VIAYSSVDLPQPDSPHDGQELARCHVEAHLVDGNDIASVRPVGD